MATSESTALPHPHTPSRFKWPGFQTWKQGGLTLQIAEDSHRLTPELKVGEVSTNVEVSATAASVDLVTPTTGSIISNVTLAETPLTGQNVYGLASLTPGMTGGGVTTAGNDNYTNEYAINLNAAGLRQEENGYQIDDGYTNTPSRGGGTSISPNPEIVQSMDIRTNDFDAQKGRNAGSTVDVYTVSGSNQFHGNIDWYFTNNSSLRDHSLSEFGFDFLAQRDGRHHGRADFQEQALLVRRHRCAAFKQPQQLHGHSGNAGLRQLGQDQRTQHGRLSVPHHGAAGDIPH
jgi:hypothetical protein